jgi:uncharacterized protein YjbI with pentapeptide repeats
MEKMMREPLSLEQFLNQRDLPAFQKYHMPKSDLYNLKQFLIDNNYAQYNDSSNLTQLNKTVFNPTWNMSYLYAEGLDFRDCSVAGCYLVYGDYSHSLFTPDALFSENLSNGTNFSFSKCQSTIFSSIFGGNRLVSKINLSTCDLTGAIFNGIYLYNSTFIGSNLSNCQFMRCELRENIIFDFSNLLSSNFTDCNIYSSSFHSAHLEDTTFLGCCIQGSDGKEIDFSKSTLDNVHLVQDSSDNCPEISSIDLRDAHIKNSQLTNLKLANVKINDNFSLENSVIYQTRIRVGDDQCIYSCQLQQYFGRHNIHYANVKFTEPGYICWDDNSIDGTSSCKDSSLDSRPLIAGLIGFGAAVMLLLFIIAAIKIHRNYIRPFLNQRQMIKQVKWKTWPLTKAISESDVDALHQIREMAGEFDNKIPRELYMMILSMRVGQTDEKYRHAKIEFGDPLPSYQAPVGNVRASGIRFFDTKDRVQYRRQQIDNTVTQFFRHRIQRTDEATPLLGVKMQGSLPASPVQRHDLTTTKELPIGRNSL